MSSKAKTPRKAAPKKRGAKERPAPAKKEAVVEAKKEEHAHPTGPAPKAFVSSRHNGGMVEREARGFSVGEIGAAGFAAPAAGRLGLAVDIRRRTVLGRNVDALKKWFVRPTEEPKPAPAPPVEKAAQEKPKKRQPRKKAAKQPRTRPRTWQA